MCRSKIVLKAAFSFIANAKLIAKHASAAAIPLVLATASNWVFPCPLASAAEPQSAYKPPRLYHATPWTPTPATPSMTSESSTSAPQVGAQQGGWTGIGPAPLAAANHVSGRITGIAASPLDPNVIFVAAAGGGVWGTDNGGASWIPLTDTQITLSMGAIALSYAVSGPNGVPAGSIIYGGTGEANNSGDSNYGRGVLISRDGGLDWGLSSGPANVFNRLTTSQIAIDPTNGLVAYAAMADFGTNGLCCANTGIWETTDGGMTWTNTTTSIDSTLPWSAVVVDPNQPRTLYAAAGDPFGAGTNGVYKSTNGGSTWNLLAAAPKGLAAGRIAIGISRANSQVVYVTASGTGNAGSTPFGTLYKVMRSDNGGGTYIY